MPMKIRLFQVDAFAERVFAGNPAAVCPLDEWLDDETLQGIALENNLSETAFIVPSGKGFNLRWFTPVAEVELCGHATLASAHVIFEHLGYGEEVIEFQTQSGMLKVERQGGLLAMDFPALPPQPCSQPAALVEALGQKPVEVLAASDYVVVFASEAVVRSLTPDFGKLSALDLRGVCVTAPGETSDFVSRFFAPALGVPEDPVTGSAHCELAPFWAKRLGKDILSARQVSKRGGDIICEVRGERVVLSGRAVTFMEGEITIQDRSAKAT